MAALRETQRSAILAARASRGGAARVLRLPARTLAQAEIHEPAQSRANKEIGGRSDVVGIYPNDRALIRLAGMLLIEQNDEWLVQRRYLSDHSIRPFSPLSGLRTLARTTTP
jgi:hypothetical protein